MIRYTAFIFILAILVLGGCKVGPNYEAPAIETSTSFMYDSLMGDSTVNIEWWELFDDEQLDTLIKTALANNLSVLQAASRVNEAKAYLGFNQADLWPALGYNGNVLVPDNSKMPQPALSLQQVLSGNWISGESSAGPTKPRELNSWLHNMPSDGSMSALSLMWPALILLIWTSNSATRSLSGPLPQGRNLSGSLQHDLKKGSPRNST